MIPMAKPLIGEEEKNAVMGVLDSGMITQGPVTKKFEERFAEFIGSKHAVATDSGASAIHLALLAHNVGVNDEVITSPFTFISSVNPILYVGAKPVFVDIENDTFNLNPDLIEEKITDNTKVILPVHLYGNPCDMNKINNIAKKYNLVVIEDACQAHNASIDNQKIGDFNTTCFSFHPTKNMATAKGGIITTNDNKIVNFVNIMRFCGEENKSYYNMLGYNYRTTDINSAICLEQLKKLDNFTEKRISNASFFNKNIKVEGIILPNVKEGFKHVFHQYTIRITKDCNKTRNEIMELLKNNNISSQIHYLLPIHKQRLYKNYSNEIYPIAERMSEEVLSIPIHPALCKDDLNKIVDTLNLI